MPGNAPGKYPPGFGPAGSGAAHGAGQCGAIAAAQPTMPQSQQPMMPHGQQPMVQHCLPPGMADPQIAAAPHQSAPHQALQPGLPANLAIDTIHIGARKGRREVQAQGTLAEAHPPSAMQDHAAAVAQSSDEEVRLLKRMLGLPEDASRPDVVKELQERAKFKSTADAQKQNGMAQAHSPGTMAGGFARGDRVVSHIAYNDARGSVAPGDVGVVNGPCDDINLNDAVERLHCTFPQLPTGANMHHAHLHHATRHELEVKSSSTQPGGFVATELGLVGPRRGRHA